MSEPFDRTTRYLATDGGGLALAGTALGLIIASLWLAWLFLAQVPVYAQTQSALPEPDGAYSVTVDLPTAVRLKPGQQASFQPSPEGGAAAAPLLAARVAEVDLASGQVRIELDDPDERPAGGIVWIVTEQVTPATLIARAVEQVLASR